MIRNEDEVTPFLTFIKSKPIPTETEKAKKHLNFNEDETDEIVLLLDFFERETQN